MTKSREGAENQANGFVVLHQETGEFLSSLDVTVHAYAKLFKHL
jgi:hypothetical protein